MEPWTDRKTWKKWTLSHPPTQQQLPFAGITAHQ
jgi:hypothetical protein